MIDEVPNNRNPSAPYDLSSIVKLWQPEHEHSPSSATDCGTLSLGGHFSYQQWKNSVWCRTARWFTQKLKKITNSDRVGLLPNSDLAEIKSLLFFLNIVFLCFLGFMKHENKEERNWQLANRQWAEIAKLLANYASVTSFSYFPMYTKLALA